MSVHRSFNKILEFKASKLSIENSIWFGFFSTRLKSIVDSPGAGTCFSIEMNIRESSNPVEQTHTSIPFPYWWLASLYASLACSCLLCTLHSLDYVAFIGLHYIALHRSTAASSGRLWRRRKREMVSLGRNTRLYYHHLHPHPRHLVSCCLRSLYLRSSPLLAPFDQTMANIRNTIISLVIQLIQQLQV